MTKNIIKPLIKITAFTSIFLILLTIGNQAIAWWLFDKKTESTTNKETFISNESTELNEVGVALNINIGTKFYEKSKIDDESLYNEILSSSTVLTNSKRVKEIILEKNLNTIKDYANISKIDIKSYLDSGENREDSYNSLLNQLKVRYKSAYVNSKNLLSQRDMLMETLNGLEKSIQNTKQLIGVNVKNYNSKELSANIDQYIELKNQYNIVRTYIVFCNKFLTYYKALNNYNMNVINVLKLNKNSIISNSYVVIPNSGNDLIKKLNLIYDENNSPTLSNSISNTYESGTSYEPTMNMSDYSENNSNYNSNGIFGDPFNMNNSSEVIKQNGNINFGVSRLGTNN